MDRLIISVAVGYMLKVLKSGKEILHKKEFNAIRHGDYIKFINLVEGPMAYIASCNLSDGVLTSGYFPPSEKDIDFLLLIKAGPSLNIFLKNCRSTYGRIEDLDISDDIYEKLALFEINLRIHASNDELTSSKDVLKDVIDKLGAHKNISSEEIAKIHQGRNFLNMVKHNRKQFKSWTDGIIALNTADDVLKKHSITP